MIGVKKISHASYETPDLEKQVEYYTNVLGLALIAREKDAAYLANTVEHHSVILRSGSQPSGTRIGFQLGPEDDLDAFETLREKLDPRKSNGGVFLGLNGIVIKSHGGTDAEGFASAIDLGYDMVRYELRAKISQMLGGQTAGEIRAPRAGGATL